MGLFRPVAGQLLMKDLCGIFYNGYEGNGSEIIAMRQQYSSKHGKFLPDYTKSQPVRQYSAWYRTFELEKNTEKF